MSFDKIKEKLEALKAAQERQASGGGRSNDLVWKPSPGKQVIRLIPNKHTEQGYPFHELYFYYDLGAKTWLSPSSFGNFDPVIEYCNNLTSKKLAPDEFKTAMALKKKLLPKERFYCPVIVRGEGGAADQLKFWGFGKKIFQELLTIMDDSEYGDITDLHKGTDITVEYAPAKTEGAFPETTIRCKRNSSIATEDSELIAKIEAMPNLIDNFTIPSDDDLKRALGEYFKGKSDEPEPAPIVNSTDVRVNHEATNQGFDVKIKIPDSILDFEKEFEDLLNSNNIPF